MTKVIVSARVLALINGNVQQGYAPAGNLIEASPGFWYVDIDDEVAAFIEARRQPFETDDELIERLVVSATGILQ